MALTRPLRLGLVCPYDLDVPGGVREQVLGLARTMLRAGHEASVLAPRARGTAPRATVDGVLVHSAGPAVPLPTNGSTARLGLGPRARHRAANWALDGDFDVVHVHEPIPPGVGHTVLRRLAAARRGSSRPAGGRGPAVVATVHVAMSPWPAGRSRSLRTASRHVGGLLDEVDVLSAVSEHARRTLVDHLGRVPLVVPNGVDVTGWAAAAPRRDHDGPVVVVLGRADEPRKGVDVLLRAWPRVRQAVPGARLVVVGPARGDLGAGGGAGVQLVGRVTEDAKRALVSGADVLVAPHRGGESFGIVLVEAMATGTPVVASDLPAFRDVLGGTGALVPAGDPAALAAAVLDVLQGRRAPALTAAARRRADGYGWDAVGQAWLLTYELALEVAAGPDAALARLHRDLAARAATATSLAAAAGARPWWVAALAEAARAASDVHDLPAQSRLTALVRSGALPGPVAQQLAQATAQVAAVRALANDAARRRGLGTTELDDDAGGAGTSRVTWPWCPSLPGWDASTAPPVGGHS
ncbi:glycosyltransferase family 4 protein [Jannaschia sp. R86511]|uniref:glycosyltransferase family 4 protein n=1 Tax=Jannaschia sp. R86511 TaxID=3093853 RepID=UPI0036D28661